MGRGETIRPSEVATQCTELQDVALPARLRPPAPMSDDDLMAFAEANKPCKVERLASGEILVATHGGFAEQPPCSLCLGSAFRLG